MSHDYPPCARLGTGVVGRSAGSAVQNAQCGRMGTRRPIRSPESSLALEAAARELSRFRALRLAAGFSAARARSRRGLTSQVGLERPRIEISLAEREGDLRPAVSGSRLGHRRLKEPGVRRCREWRRRAPSASRRFNPTQTTQIVRFRSTNVDVPLFGS